MQNNNNNNNNTTTTNDFSPGKVVRCSPCVRRVLAPNPSMMTGPGTNTYIIGNGDIAVLDPGPNIDSHVQALLNATQGEVIRYIFSTHTHKDHSPGTSPLLAALGNLRRQTEAVTVIGLAAPKHGESPLSSHDQSFLPSVPVRHGDCFKVGELTIEAVFTPGHASNHICYLLQEEQLLFTGDHIMDGSTVVIAPPDGDMRAYLTSLALLNTYDISQFAPAHGNFIDNPKEIVEATIAHRLKRENKVIASVKAKPNSTIKELVSLVYDDTPSFLHPIAEFSLRAHLIKLEAESKIIQQAERWTWI